MKKQNHAPAQSPEELLNDLRTLVAEAEKMMESSVNEHSEEALEAVRVRVEAAQERLTALYDGTRKKVVDGARATDAAIRANPYQAVAIAVGVGVLVGLLLGRRSK